MPSNRAGELPTHRTPGPTDRQPGAPYSLLVLEGPDAGASYTLDAGSPLRVLVGTSPMCTFRLSDNAISRRHAGFRLEESGLVVSDLGSTNGTSVNGVRIREAVLSGGEAVRIGKTVLSVKREAASHVRTPEASTFGRILGNSHAMRKLFPVLQTLADSEHAALIEGESGVGKELLAEEIHAHGPRAGRPFVVVACHSLAPSEIGAKLFGSEGVLTTGGGGTVFVDEVATLPLDAQDQLLRFLGEPAPQGTAPRLLLATRHDLDRLVAAQKFREDLLNRLAVARVEVPPLRDRHGDVALLAKMFWEVLASADPERASEPLPSDFLPRFESYAWPGNVRELSLAIAVRFNLGELGRWRTEALRGGGQDFLHAVVDRELPLSEARKIIVEEFERRYVGYMLARHGSTRDAAVASGVALRYFQLLRARSEQ